MKAVDTNILVYAHRAEMPWHDAAEKCVRQLAEDTAAWAIPWPCIHEFLAIATNPRIFRTPSPMPVAMAQVEAWLASPTLVLLGETPAHWQVLRDFLEQGKVVGAMTHDARVAAICRQHGVNTLLSADRDFSRFRGLRVVNPFAS